MQNRSRNLGFAVPVAVWLVGVALMVYGAADPGSFDATASEYGENWPGDLARGLWWSTAEAGVLALVLRPWSFRRSWGRLLLALALLLPWTVFNLVATMHGGPIMGAHVWCG